MYKLLDFLKVSFEKNSYVVNYCEIDGDDFGEFAVVEFHKDSKHFAINYNEYMGATTEPIKWGLVYPELEATFLIVNETLNSNGYKVEIYGAYKNKDLGMIVRYKLDSKKYALTLKSFKPK